ncbi:MAG: AbrB/MazE/SpoVT family DNA-binding domain-containing protein [Candidatus Thiodiazotropha sp. (ex Lucinoma borealis)]|nr:AbrB/MazE/SpoVT family DNA-binding domain-containing protein [Candidatus Thiodiazotropha sp. (ex Lucinoma borealis)]
MRTLIKKWGNSASVRIPAAIMAASNLQIDSAVDIREEGGRIIIEPVNDQECDLEVLVSGITSENIHSEVCFGPPVGNETL